VTPRAFIPDSVVPAPSFLARAGQRVREMNEFAQDMYVTAADMAKVRAARKRLEELRARGRSAKAAQRPMRLGYGEFLQAASAAA